MSTNPEGGRLNCKGLASNAPRFSFSSVCEDILPFQSRFPPGPRLLASSVHEYHLHPAGREKTVSDTGAERVTTAHSHSSSDLFEVLDLRTCCGIGTCPTLPSISRLPETRPLAHLKLELLLDSFRPAVCLLLGFPGQPVCTCFLSDTRESKIPS